MSGTRAAQRHAHAHVAHLRTVGRRPRDGLQQLLHPRRRADQRRGSVLPHRGLLGLLARLRSPTRRRVGAASVRMCLHHSRLRRAALRAYDRPSRLPRAGRGPDCALVRRGARRGPLPGRQRPLLPRRGSPHRRRHTLRRARADDLPRNPRLHAALARWGINPAVWLAQFQRLDCHCTRALGTSERVLRRAREVAQQRFHGISLCRAVFATTPADGFT